MRLQSWIVDHCDRTFRKGNWAGPGVLPALRGVPLAVAHRRPHPQQHTIAEIALHMAYWKDAVAAVLRGQPWSFDKTLNWRAVPSTKRGWTSTRTALRKAHTRLLSSLRRVPPARLLRPLTPQSSRKAIDLAIDIATHDSYHVAQIFVLRRLSKARTK